MFVIKVELWLRKIENLVLESLTNFTSSFHPDKIENRYVERKNFDWNFSLSRNFWRAHRNRLQLVDKVRRRKKIGSSVHYWFTQWMGYLENPNWVGFLKFSIFFPHRDTTDGLLHHWGASLPKIIYVLYK